MTQKTETDISSVIHAAISADRKRQAEAAQDEETIAKMRILECPLANALAEVCTFSETDKNKVKETWAEKWRYYKSL